MTLESLNLLPALPEIFLLCAVSTILIVDLFIPERNRSYTYLLSLLTLVACAGITLGSADGEITYAFNGMFVDDPLSDLLDVCVVLGVAGVLVYSHAYARSRQLFRGEFFTLALFSTLGMMVMISANHLLTLYLGLELMSLSLYSMVALQRDSARSTEAAMKYFVLGALASGMLLYGMSMLYGATGSLGLAEIGDYVRRAPSDDKVLLFGMTFVVVGLAFKLGAVPFHMWIPDVYHGAPTAVTLFIGTAPKIAAFAMVIRLLADGLGGLHVEWRTMLMVLAVLSIGIGNVIAIAQRNVKRMLAYSTISHVGFLLLGILAGTRVGNSAAMFYILVYSLMTLGAFGMVILLSRAGFEADELEDFKGLNERNPWFAFLMLIVMFSMAGIPPTVGFYAKLSVLRAVIDVGLVWLAVFAVLFSVVGAFYYLRLVKFMYFDRPEDSAPLAVNFDMRAVMSVNGLLILGLGIYPGALMGLCAAVMN